LFIIVERGQFCRQTMDLGSYAPQDTTPSVSQHVVTIINSGHFYDYLPFDTEESCKVQFAHAAKFLYEQKYFFTITLASEIPRGVRLLLVFPANRAILDTSKERNVAAINAFIDANLGRDPKTHQMVLCVGDSLYKVSGVTGRLYLQWAAILEYTADRTPSRWRQTPVLATTNGHFKCTGLYPVFGQERNHSFIGRGRWKMYAPRGYVVWSLDCPRTAKAVQCEAMSKATVTDRGTRDMIPDHEMDKYQEAMTTITTAAATDGETSDTASDRDDHRAGEASTASEDYDSATVIIKEMPTPRPFASTQTASLVLTSGFFDLDAESSSSPDVAHSRHAPAPSPPYDFDVGATRYAQDRWNEQRDYIPMMAVAPRFSAPKDSRTRRMGASATTTAGRPTARLEDSSE